MEKEKCYFRIKTSWTGEAEDGAITTIKQECIVSAINYTEAEMIANALFARERQAVDFNYEIAKIKISEVLFSSTFELDELEVNGKMIEYYVCPQDISEEGIYSITVELLDINEVTGKEKKSKENIFVASKSSTAAINYVKNYLKDVETRNWNVRDVKFDKSTSVIVTREQHQSNELKFSKYN